MANRIIRRLAALLDVDLTGITDGDALTYRSSDGKIIPGAGGGGGSSTLAGLSDVTGTAGTGKAPVSNGAGGFPLTDVATQAELDVEVAARGSAISGLASVYQPLDSDLTAVAALSTTSFGRGLLALADAAALRTAAGLGTAATAATGDFDAAGAAAAAQAASQPLDSDLTAIASLSTTSFGRGLLALADAAAARTSLSLVPGTDVEAHDTGLTTIAGLSPTNDDVLQRKSGAWANRTVAQLLTDLAAPGTTFQPLDSDLTALAGLAIAADKLPYGNGSHTMALADFTAAARTLLDDADASAMLTTLGVSTFIKTLLDDADAATARATLGVPSVLGYQEFTSSVSVTHTTAATADTVVTAPAFTADGTSTYIIEFFAPLVRVSAIGAISFQLYLDGADIGTWSQNDLPTANNGIMVYMRRRIVPASGSRTFSCRARVASGTGTVFAGAGGSGNTVPGYIMVVQA